MRLSAVGSAAACLSMAHAFRDTSPFFLASTSQFPDSVEVPAIRQLEKSHTVLNDAKQLLSSCPSDEYIIISQPGVSASDFTETKPFAVLLGKALQGSDVQSRVDVAEVVGSVKVDEVQAYIQSTCGAQVVTVDPTEGFSELDGTFPRIVRVDFPEVSQTGAYRKSMLQQQDAKLQYILGEPRSSKYTIIYITTPPSDQVEDSLNYEPTFNMPLHTEMKRQTNYVREAGNSTSAPLFTKYQFLTPGLFMGLLVGLVLLAILAVGINAVASLEVSYGAFEKEMGPTGPKKQQ